jgi:hypothetical protein
MYRSLQAYCTTRNLRRSNLHHQVPCTSQRRQRTYQWKVELLGEKWPVNLAWKQGVIATFRVLLHAANLRHGTGRLLLPLRRKARWGFFFFALKNLMDSAGFEPANLGTKGQHATSRPPKPLSLFNMTWFCKKKDIFGKWRELRNHLLRWTCKEDTETHCAVNVL